MSIVIDASVLVAATVDTGAEGIWADEIIAQNEIVAPHLILVESTNILRRLEHSKNLTSLEAAAAQRDVIRLNIDLIPFEPFADRIWELRRNVTSYDAWYVAVAEAFQLPLATLDRRLARATGPTCQFATPTKSR